MQRTFGKTKLVLKQGDLTLEDADAIVNAANPTLMGGGGVDGAVHRRGGPAILEECREIRAKLGRMLAHGEAVMTGGGRLAARHVIHAVGPIYAQEADPEARLAEAYRNALGLAISRGLRSVAFPSLSTGAYGFPVCLAAPVALGAVRRRLLEPGHRLGEVRFVLFDAETLQTYAMALDALPSR